MPFLGRKREIEILRDVYNNEKFESIILYGRRRIGKSELIKYSFKDINCKKIYFECQKATEAYNVSNLCDIIASTFKIPKPAFQTLSQILDFLFEKSLTEKIIFVIDEYPYIRDNSFYLDSIIQNAIDKYKMDSKMKFILCGSYIDVMEKLLSNNSPLYGRFSLKMNVRQMNYLESSLFYPNASNEDKVAYYSVFGGVPFYNQFIDDTKTVKENIINLIASPNARLLTEAEGFLLEKMTKLTNANECFCSIALGNRKYTDILNASHISSSPMLSDILKKLIKMDVIEKICPINDENEKKATYEIIERLSLFYYRYIFAKNTFFKIMPPNLFYDEFIEPDFYSQYVPKEFENISKQYFQILNSNHKITPVLYAIGKYYYDDPKNRKNGEFDVVTLDKNGYNFYEVKFINKPIDDSIVNEEEYQLENLKIKYNKLGFISKTGFNLKKPEKYSLITLDDMYKI